MLASLYDQMEPEATAKGLTIRVVPTGAWVVSDPVLLERILRNLLVNAIRYTEQGGVVLGCRRRGDKVAICVVDSGMGIPADKFEAVFEDFTRLGEKGAGGQRGLGLGLGLSVVRRTARLLEHGVELRSRPGKGSCFAVVARTQ
jgi:signal transduction histidine kinase